MRTLVVDDSALFREALVALLADGSNCQVIGVAADGWEACQIARAARPDLILMDVNMPVRGGLEATRRIKAEMPHIRILLLTASSAEAIRAQALSDGAEDCVDKDASRILLAVKRLSG